MEDNILPPAAALSDAEKEWHNRLVLSYLTLRRLIGVTGMLLPVILVLSSVLEMGWSSIQLSISDYYYTNRGDILVGIICMLCVFLFTYKGYNWQDILFTRLAALCGFGVALFPTANHPPADPQNIHITSRHIVEIPHVGELHLVFATVFFISLSCISLFLFTKSDKPEVVPFNPPGKKMTQKDRRNIVYIACGIVMLLCVAVLTVYFKSDTLRKKIEPFPLTFWLESLALEAFGVSWFVKGRTLLQD